MKTISYLDNAATTKISESVLEGMLPYLSENYGNPSSLYALGQEAYLAVSKAREQVARALNCTPKEIYFTSGGSESNNWVLRNYTNVITCEFEHHAVLHAAPKDAILLPVYNNGIVKVCDLEKALSENPDTELVTVMHVNNEIGTIQPVSEIGAVCKKHGVLFHTDAVAAIGSVPVDVKAMNVDMLSLSGHKIHAMKGVGALYVRNGIKLPPLIRGGAQEFNKRAGTENVAGIVGLGIAITEAVAGLEEKNSVLLKKRERIYSEIMKIQRVRLNGELENRVAGNLNFSFEGIEGESLLLQLDLKGIAASSGSACTSGSLDPSHVLLALGLPHEIAHGSLRITLSKYTTDEEIDCFLEVLPPIVEKLRALSPLWEKIEKGEPV